MLRRFLKAGVEALAVVTTARRGVFTRGRCRLDGVHSRQPLLPLAYACAWRSLPLLLGFRHPLPKFVFLALWMFLPNGIMPGSSFTSRFHRTELTVRSMFFRLRSLLTGRTLDISHLSIVLSISFHL